MHPRATEIAPSQASASKSGASDTALAAANSGKIRSRPMMPSLTTSADETALIGLGAMAWASGSQTCTGNRPALTRKPAVRPASASSTGGRDSTVASRSATSAMFRLPVSACSTPMQNRMSTEDTAPATRYLNAASAAVRPPPTATSA